ncbi:MAG: hypothetical protein LBP63_08280 [Prevotellaceae bacterium]|jgi:hypothetical protein|nr:hypothetical protein [Prevotellaceae bacterium]
MRILPVILLGFYTSYAFAQGSGGGVKVEIFHVDLVPLTATYGGAELAFTVMMKNTMDKIIEAQAITDTMFRKMVILEEKTQEYQRNLQAHLLRSLNEGFFDDMLKIIDGNQSWMDDYASKHPAYKKLIEEHQEYIQGRAHNIKRYIDNVTKKTGNEGRLDNVQRNDLNLYVIEQMRELCYVSQSLRRMLNTVFPDEDILKIPIKID